MHTLGLMMAEAAVEHGALPAFMMPDFFANDADWPWGLGVPRHCILLSGSGIHTAFFHSALSSKSQEVPVSGLGPTHEDISSLTSDLILRDEFDRKRKVTIHLLGAPTEGMVLTTALAVAGFCQTPEGVGVGDMYIYGDACSGWTLEAHAAAIQWMVSILGFKKGIFVP